MPLDIIEGVLCQIIPIFFRCRNLKVSLPTGGQWRVRHQRHHPLRMGTMWVSKRSIWRYCFILPRCCMNVLLEGRLAYTNCLQNLVLLDSFPNFRPWWFDKQWNVIHPTITSSAVARIVNKPLKLLNLSFEFLGQIVLTLPVLSGSIFQRQLVIIHVGFSNPQC